MISFAIQKALPTNRASRSRYRYMFVSAYPFMVDTGPYLSMTTAGVWEVMLADCSGAGFCGRLGNLFDRTDF